MSHHPHGLQLSQRTVSQCLLAVAPSTPSSCRIDKRLKPLCVRALKRVFVMCDADQDGALSDTELNSFQQICFNMALTDEELQNVKQVSCGSRGGGGWTLQGRGRGRRGRESRKERQARPGRGR